MGQSLAHTCPLGEAISSGDGPILVATGFKGGATGYRKGNCQITIADDDTAGVTVNAAKLSVAADSTTTMP